MKVQSPIFQILSLLPVPTLLSDPKADLCFLRSLEEIEREFDRRGVSKADWAREHGIRPGVVYEIFSRRSSCKRGEALRAAVLLGLKEGVIEERVSA